MLYFSYIPINPASIDKEQYRVLETFKNSYKARGIYETYSTTGEFKDKFARQLSLILNKHDYFARESNEERTLGVYAPSGRINDLSKDALTLLEKATQDPHGQILKISTFGGDSINTNGEEMLVDNTHKEFARWEGALIELERYGLVKPINHKREIFVVTREGYKAIESLGQ